VFLFIPLLLAIASLFTDGVAEAVERQHYPALPAAQGASAIAQAWAGTRLAARMAAITVLLLPIALFVPVIGVIVLWVVAAVSLGEGLFQGVALRRMPAPDAEALARALRWQIRGVGGVLAAMALIAPLNLLVPVIGTAAMVHVLHRSALK
jgi:CysZ protein